MLERLSLIAQNFFNSHLADQHKQLSFCDKKMNPLETGDDKRMLFRKVIGLIDGADSVFTKRCLAVLQDNDADSFIAYDLYEHMKEEDDVAYSVLDGIKGDVTLFARELLRFSFDQIRFIPPALDSLAFTMSVCDQKNPDYDVFKLEAESRVAVVIGHWHSIDHPVEQNENQNVFDFLLSNPDQLESVYQSLSVLRDHEILMCRENFHSMVDALEESLFIAKRISPLGKEENKLYGLG